LLKQNKTKQIKTGWKMAKLKRTIFSCSGSIDESQTSDGNRPESKLGISLEVTKKVT
jgi:hypothetical protein